MIVVSLSGIAHFVDHAARAGTDFANDAQVGDVGRVAGDEAFLLFGFFG